MSKEGDTLMQAQRAYRQERASRRAEFRCRYCGAWTVLSVCPNTGCPSYGKRGLRRAG